MLLSQLSFFSAINYLPITFHDLIHVMVSFLIYCILILQLTYRRGPIVSGAISRSQFLRGDFTNKHAPIRPPWASEESAFIASCSQCSDCISACPENIIVNGTGNYPVIDFTNGECTFCFECVESCNDHALSGDADSQPWSLQASVSKQCMVFQGVHCMVCRDQCEAEAITFMPKVNQPAYPHINAALCTGCGACFQPCPSQSIEISYQLTNNNVVDSTLKETVI